MLGKYVLADLIRNPRRTLSTMAGVILGVGLFCGVLFFIDGLSASMSQRAVAPLAIDMQRIVTERAGDSIRLTETIEGSTHLVAGERTTIGLELRNDGAFPANEVTLRSELAPGLAYVAGSAERDGAPIPGYEDNPFAHGPGRAGLNVGTISPGASLRFRYTVRAETDTTLDRRSPVSTFSSRESANPTRANQPPPVGLTQLASRIARIDGVAQANELSIADLGPDTLSTSRAVATGPTKIFGIDARYAERDANIDIVEGALREGKAALSVEAATSLGVRPGDSVRVRLPDESTFDVTVSAIADLSRARSLFSSRRGGDLETFIYSPNAVIVSPALAAERVFPAYEAAATGGDQRLKNPPIREVDVTLDHQRLDADPATAVSETKRIASEVSAVAAHQDYLLDNITNTLTVAADDADVAKRLFIFLGVPGVILAAFLAGYAGNVLAEAQRREQATLRIRGASRRHLLRMLALRTALLTGAGALVGLALGYLSAAAILGRESLDRANPSDLALSAVLGTAGGFLATGLALYATGRRSIDREINEDRARLTTKPPLWRRAGLDVIGVVVVVVGTAVAIATHSFDGAAGSVYFGRAVDLNLVLLVLPVAVWVAGSLLAARMLGASLARSCPRSTGRLGPPVPALFRRSVGRRPWAVGNGAIVVALIVALAASLAAFTASYDAAKVADARFTNGADIRITPSPKSENAYTVQTTSRLRTDGVESATPVVYASSNVILRSDRTSDPGNLAAVDPASFATVAPVQDRHFSDGDAAAALGVLRRDPSAILVSTEMAEFLQVKPGDSLHVLLARATSNQTDVRFRVAGIFERLPAFPDGADALMSIAEHTARVPAKPPDFFLAKTTDPTTAGLDRAVASLTEGPGAAGDLRFDTRETTLARDQSSLAALNIAGLIDLDSGFALTMAVVTIAIFVFGLLLSRRREYVTLRAQGLDVGSLRRLITLEAGTVAVAGAISGLLVGTAMGYYFVRVLRPLFVLPPRYSLPVGNLFLPVAIVVIATLAASVIAAWMLQRLEPTELLRDE